MQKVVLRIFSIVFILLIQTSFSFAQTDTTQVISKHDPSFISKQIVPIWLISSGALLNIGNIKYRIQDKLPTTNSRLDNYFRYVPIAQLYVFDAFGFEHQNTVFDQTKYLLISQLLSGGIVNLLKNVTNVERPSGDNHSFPSDHTSKAFVGATVLYHEFKDTEPLLAWSGYLFATATGALRMTNNAHWLPDVLAGAGIAILTTNLVYYFKPLQNFQPFKKNKELTITPIITPGALAIHCRF
ncbi:phosphatase PAP2 family protein [uncultured Draconibacterium sp.]|uniref:phosphatase PAP2 family protein n=1 Tax=uncultured Draconibacterium sp. TaxID=1573823 RepID=UPI0029C636B9|nr:phosphatase PAP2 family protein [uncultured Draconibacterium sp.]